MGLSTILAMNFREGREGITGVTSGSGRIRALSQSEAMEAPQAGFLGLASNILTMFVHRVPLIAAGPLTMSGGTLCPCAREQSRLGDSYPWGTVCGRVDHTLTKVSPP